MRACVCSGRAPAPTLSSATIPPPATRPLLLPPPVRALLASAATHTRACLYSDPNPLPKRTVSLTRCQVEPAHAPPPWVWHGGWRQLS